MFFHRHRNDVIAGDVVDLSFRCRYPANEQTGETESICFWINTHGREDKIGECDIRLGMNEELHYAGNIGYRIYEAHRGHGYAYEAAKMLMKAGKEIYGMKEILITCSPDNIASKKTLERLNGELVETVEVPSWHWLYKRGETVKHVYRFVL